MLGVLAFVTLLLSLGPYLPGFRWLIRLPGFSFFRAPARWSLATELALCLLAGRGLEARLEAMRTHEAMPGVTVRYGTLSVGGFPFNVDAVFGDLRVEVATPRGPIVWRAEHFASHAQVIGFDNIQAVRQLLKDGQVLATVDQHGDQLAVYGIEYALEVLKNKTTPADRETAVDLITAETAPKP